MSIQWDKPVETTEDPPRPVRVLCTDAGEHYPIVALIIREPILFTGDGHEWPDGSGITLRNAPEPKPAPVLREAWVVWDYRGERSTTWDSETHACNAAAGLSGVYARAAVMSDGSPVADWFQRTVDAEAALLDMTADRDKWKAKYDDLWKKAAEGKALLMSDRDKWKDEVERITDDRNHWRRKAEQLEAQVRNLSQSNDQPRGLKKLDADTIRHLSDEVATLTADRDKWKAEANHVLARLSETEALIEVLVVQNNAMKTVVDAAVEWSSQFGNDQIAMQALFDAMQALFDVVRAYQAKQTDPQAEAIDRLTEERCRGDE